MKKPQFRRTFRWKRNSNRDGYFWKISVENTHLIEVNANVMDFLVFFLILGPLFISRVSLPNIGFRPPRAVFENTRRRIRKSANHHCGWCVLSWLFSNLLNMKVTHCPRKVVPDTVLVRRATVYQFTIKDRAPDSIFIDKPYRYLVSCMQKKF